MSGCLFVISGPSGVGKSTIIHRASVAFPSLQFSVSATTRPIRPYEVDGRDYIFVQKKDFEEMIEKGELLEYCTYVGNYYGTPIMPIRSVLRDGGDMLLDVEPIGAFRVKRTFPCAVLIYILPPSMEELARRLRCRGDTVEEFMSIRLERAQWEMRQSRFYDYVVENDSVDHAVNEVITIFNKFLTT